MVKKATNARTRKKSKRVVRTGSVYVFATFNNTIVTVTDSNGNTLDWQAAGRSGFKNARKSTPYAAQVAAKEVAERAAKEFGLQEVDVFVSGPGLGKESAVRGVAEVCRVLRIKNTTGVPHNGCRDPKERKV